MATDDERAAARKQLADLLPRVMRDGQLDAVEQDELKRFLLSGVLDRQAVRDVFAAYLEGLRAAIMADGVVTDDERARLANVIRQLRIPESFLPPEIKQILGT